MDDTNPAAIDDLSACNQISLPSIWNILAARWRENSHVTLAGRKFAACVGPPNSDVDSRMLASLVSSAIVASAPVSIGVCGSGDNFSVFSKLLLNCADSGFSRDFLKILRASCCVMQGGSIIPIVSIAVTCEMANNNNHVQSVSVESLTLLNGSAVFAPISPLFPRVFGKERKTTTPLMASVYATPTNILESMGIHALPRLHDPSAVEGHWNEFEALVALCQLNESKSHDILRILLAIVFLNSLDVSSQGRIAPEELQTVGGLLRMSPADLQALLKIESTVGSGARQEFIRGKCLFLMEFLYGAVLDMLMGQLHTIHGLVPPPHDNNHNSNVNIQLFMLPPLAPSAERSLMGDFLVNNAHESLLAGVLKPQCQDDELEGINFGANAELILKVTSTCLRSISSNLRSLSGVRSQLHKMRSELGTGVLSNVMASSIGFSHSFGAIKYDLNDIWRHSSFSPSVEFLSALETAGVSVLPAGKSSKPWRDGPEYYASLWTGLQFKSATSSLVAWTCSMENHVSPLHLLEQIRNSPMVSECLLAQKDSHNHRKGSRVQFSEVETVQYLHENSLYQSESANLESAPENTNTNTNVRINAAGSISSVPAPSPLVQPAESKSTSSSSPMEDSTPSKQAAIQYAVLVIEEAYTSRLQPRIQAVKKIQKWWRRILRAMADDWVFSQLNGAAIVVQKTYRGYKTRQMASKILKKQKQGQSRGDSFAEAEILLRDTRSVVREQRMRDLEQKKKSIRNSVHHSPLQLSPRTLAAKAQAAEKEKTEKANKTAAAFKLHRSPTPPGYISLTDRLNSPKVVPAAREFSFKPTINKASKRMARNSAGTLYERGQEHRKRVQERLDQLKKQQEEEELQEVKAIPTVRTGKAVAAAEDVPDLVERMEAFELKRQKNLSDLREKMEAEKMAEVKKSPAVSKVSLRLARERTLDNMSSWQDDKTSKLEKMKERLRLEEEKDSEHIVHLSKGSKMILKRKGLASQSFADRMAANALKHKERLEALKKQAEQEELKQMQGPAIRSHHPTKSSSLSSTAAANGKSPSPRPQSAQSVFHRLYIDPGKVTMMANGGAGAGMGDDEAPYSPKLPKSSERIVRLRQERVLEESPPSSMPRSIAPLTPSHRASADASLSSSNKSAYAEWKDMIASYSTRVKK